MRHAISPRYKKAVGDMRLAAGRCKAAARGQALVEFALMLPLLILMWTGVVEIGRAIFYTIEVNNGATAGAEYGAQSPIQMKDINGMQRTATADANFAPMTATATYGCTCDNGDGTSCSYPLPAPSSCQNSCPSGQIIRCVQVTTHADFAPLFNYPGLPTSYQANGRAVMRVRN